MADRPKIKTVLRVTPPEPEIKNELTQVLDSVVLGADQPGANLSSELAQTGDAVVVGSEPGRPQLPADLLETGDAVVVGSEPGRPQLPPDLLETGDAIAVGFASDKPSIGSNLTPVEDAPAISAPKTSPSLPAGLSDVQDVQIINVSKASPPLPPVLPDVQDSLAVGVPAPSPPLPAVLLETGDAVTLRPKEEPPVLPPVLPDVQDISTINVPVTSTKLPPELSETGDAIVLIREPIKPSLPPDLLETGDVIVLRPDDVRPSLSPELPQIPDDSYDQRKEYSFDGAWLPDGSPINIGAKNYETLKNFRYKDDGIEGIDGFTRINSTVCASARVKNGIQLKTNYTKPSYILAQGEAADGTAKVVYKNESTVPGQADFAVSHAYVDTSAAAVRSRFSMLPGGQVGICGGGKNLIWAGEEMPISAFWIGSFGTSSMAAGTKAMVFTSDQGGPVTLNLTETTTYTCDELATLLQAAMNANNTLTGTGTITFTVTNQMGKFKIDAGAGHTIAYDYTGSTAYDMFGFTNDLAAAQTITGDEFASRGSLKPYFNPNLMQDVTKKLQNTNTDSENIVTLGATSSDKFYLIGVTRPISGINHTIVSGTLNASVLTVKYCDGKKFVTAGTITDGATAGHVTFTSTVNLAKPLYVNGSYLYFYLCELSSGTPVISYVTVNAPIQDCVNLWDGITRTATKCELFTTKYIDYTLKVASEVDLVVAPMVQYDFMLTGSANTITLMFTEQITALKIKLSQPTVGTSEGYLKITYNKNDSTSGTAYIYHNSTSLLLVPLKDINGIVAWEKPSDEEPTFYRDVKGYKYTLVWYLKDSAAQFAFSGTAASCPVIDTITGITAHRTVTNTYIFPFQYGNRAMLCGCISDSEKNRIDYSSKYSPDVYNGKDSSMQDNSQSLYFGDKTPLTGAVELFKEFSDGTDSVGVVTKNSETYIFAGDNPETFTIKAVSRYIGNPAPLTMDTAEMAIGSPNAVKQNVAIWMSDKGPVIFNGSVIQSLVDFNIKKYFTPGNALCIHDEYINIAAGIYDPNFNEYHLVIPSGTSATTNNVWLVYDLGRGKWHENVPTYDFPQAFMRVEDTLGNKYIYAVNDNGYMVRLDNGRVWSTTTYPITHTVKTGAALYSDSLWNETMVNRLKVIFDTNTEGYLEVNHYLNGNSTRTTTVGDNTTGLPPSTAPRPMRYGGVEVITNGTFETTTGWTDVGSTATLSSVADGVHGNCLQILNTGSAAAVVRQAITVVTDQLYRFTCFNKNGTGAKGKYRIGTTPGGVELKALTTFGTTTVWTINTFTFTATATTIYLDFVSDTTTINDFFYVDDVSIRAATSADDSAYSFRNLIMQCAKTVSSAYYGIIGLSHAFEFIITACSVTKPKLLGWGVQYSIPREDIVDKDG